MPCLGIYPATMSIVLGGIPEIVSKGGRGLWMGCAICAHMIGNAITLVLLTLGSTHSLWGFRGWRLYWAAIGSITVAFGCIGPMLVTEDSRPWKSFSFTQEFSTLVRNLRPASVKLLFLASLVVVTNFAGISGFLPMYLRYLDMTEV